jgi:uncharacterized protein YbaR (Trm112 family)
MIQKMKEHDTKKINKNGNKKPFLIPYRIYLIQGLLNNVISIFLLIIPIIITYLFSYARPYLSNILYMILSVILINFSLIYFIVIYGKYYSNYTLDPEFKFYKKFKSYFLRKYILKNMVCPDCSGSFLKYENKTDMSQFVEDFLYHCESCQNIYSIEKVGDFIRPTFRFKK